ncbi:hypothetical protein [Mycobacterium tuberculosis]|uniref:hypothetical protein n=1 Tax=Mycobacterium tuberculosis TaxID=1773 RepID=UPI0032B61F9B
MPGSSRRYAARIVTGLRLDCPVSAATRPASSPGSAGLPGFSRRYAARIVTGLRLDCPVSSAARPASSPGYADCPVLRALRGPASSPG